MTQYRFLTVLVDCLTIFFRHLNTRLTIHKFSAMGIWTKISAKFKSCTTAPPYPTADRFSPVEGVCKAINPKTVEYENPEIWKAESAIQNWKLFERNCKILLATISRAGSTPTQFSKYDYFYSALSPRSTSILRSGLFLEYPFHSPNLLTANKGIFFFLPYPTESERCLGFHLASENTTMMESFHISQNFQSF